MSSERPLSEPIAIVGSGCRFAGGVNNPSKLWQVLQDPKDLSKEVPPDRFNIKAFHHPDGEYHGTTNAPNSYWLEQNHKAFDAPFFNITPKEAEAIDPQQRMLLEVVYESLESAGYSLNDYSGKKVAVFAGLMTADYDVISMRDELSTSQYFATGNARSIVSNRISYFFNFNGPSMTIDTACSSSLVALHQAVHSLRSGESEMACVTGVNLILVPEQFIVESSLHMLSPTGKCKMWDVNADGYARGEGVASVLIKTLSQAIADGDHIEAIIRETGVNSDGRSKGITMPNADAQSQLIRDTYARSGLNPKDPKDRCQYFEAHGTGTQAGDPNEARAIENAFFGQGTLSSLTQHDADAAATAPRKLLVGSVKTVIGHTEGAAGLAGLIKVVQSLKHGLVVPNLHLQVINPSVAPFLDNIEVPTSLVAWPQPPPGQPRRASVNSFGFGGTNAHAIVEQFLPAVHCTSEHRISPMLNIEEPPVATEDSQRAPLGLPLLLSATSRKSLLEVVKACRDFLVANPSIDVDEFAWHAYSRRSALTYKLSVCAATREGLVRQLDLIVQSNSGASLTLGTRSKSADETPKILGIFTGQGAQWATMSRDLLASNKVYASTIRSLENILRECSDPPTWSLEQEIRADASSSRLQTAAISQPLCTALQIALVDVLQSLNIKLHAVVGHSSGEIAAAYAAGFITARDAMLISYYRGLYAHMASGPNGQKGGMIAVGLSRDEAEALCRTEKYQGRIFMAASNSPGMVTLSGSSDAIEEVRKELDAQNKFTRLVRVDTAYHTPHMEAPSVKYLELLAACGISAKPGNGTIWVSSVDGSGTPGSLELETSYWKNNMVQPVLFTEALQSALTSYGPFDCAIEVGPHPALQGPASQTMKARIGQPLPYIGMLDRNKSDSIAFGSFLGFMWSMFGSCSGQIRDFFISSCDELSGARLLDLPSYPWDHSQEYWRESRIAKQYHFKPDAPHELLGVRTRDDNDVQLRWRNILKMDNIPWSKGHVFQGQALLPASAYCVMAYDAARVVLAGRLASIIEISDLEFLNGITIEADGPGIEVLFSLTLSSEPKQSSTIEGSFIITSTMADGSTNMKKNFTGNLRIVLGQPMPKALPSRAKNMPETLEVGADAFYDMMLETGLDYQGPFRGLTHLDRRFNFSSGLVKKLHADDGTSLRISPATLDSCLQTAFVSYASPGDKALWTSFLPKAIKSVRFNTAICNLQEQDQSVLSVETYLCDAKPISHDMAALFTVDISIFNQTGDTEIQIEGLTVGSFSTTRPEHDHELYLTTIMNVDPEDEIIAPPNPVLEPISATLVESCERVAAFYYSKPRQTTALGRVSSSSSSVCSMCSYNTRSTTCKSPHRFSIAILNPEDIAEPSPWANETEETLAEFIQSSPHTSSLEFVKTLGENLADLLASMLPRVIAEAHNVDTFRRYIAQVVKQISHRYPRLNVLDLTDPEHSITEHMVDTLKDSLASYRMGIVSDESEQLAARLSHDAIIRQFLHNKIVELESKGDSSDSDALAYDVVLISASIITPASEKYVLSKVQAMMRPGAFILLVDLSGLTLKDQIARIGGHRTQVESSNNWPALLQECGFVQPARGMDPVQTPLMVRQRESGYKDLLLHPFNHDAGKRLQKKLLVIGGENQQVLDISTAITHRLVDRCTWVTTFMTLDDISAEQITSCSAVILLADLDRPILSNMDERRLNILRALLRPEMVMVWVTHDARSGNPEHAASFGFGRTMLAETPSLALQMLDLDSLNPDGAANTIAQAFASLVLHARLEKVNGSDGALWTHEPEIYMENGRRLVNRVMPWKEANERVNAPRRVVTKVANSLEELVEIVPVQENGASKYEAVAKPISISEQATSEEGLLELHFSSADVFGPGRLCLGRNVDTDKLQLILAQAHASHVAIPAHFVSDIDDETIDVPLFVAYMVRYLSVFAMMETALDSSSDPTIVLLEPDVLLHEVATSLMFAQRIQYRAFTFSAEGNEVFSGIRFIHPLSTRRDLMTLFSVDGSHVFDLTESMSDVSTTLADIAPKNCKYHHVGASGVPSAGEKYWHESVELSMAKAYYSREVQVPMFSVPDFLANTENWRPFQIVDWRAERLVPYNVKPVLEAQMLRSNRTYVLVGLTRDLGQSLCDLLVSQGARHIVLTSRNPPNRKANWVQDFANRHDVRMSIESMDVTNLEHVVALKERLATKGMPPVGGVINAAMVLEDKVFSQMTVDTLHRVLRPKTVGSANLDRVFDDPDMDFFIMTSSFAAIGGHAGQSNYAAANMYMNGLAAQRRRRGLPGTAINIGVIYGLGFLHREKGDLYVGLERDGYPPISERDLHHMFGEAIVAGRPGVKDQVYDITTGLNRYTAGSDALHWHRDPRFSHFTVRASDDDAGASGDSEEKKTSAKDLLAAAETREEMLSVLTNALARHLETLLQMPADSVAVDSSVVDLGVDSLVAVDIRAWIWKTAARDVAVMKILGQGSIGKLCQDIVDGIIAAREKTTVA